MIQDYGFVKNIENLDRKELALLRKAPSGSHIDIILQESLKNKNYGKVKINGSKKWFINSFMDINKGLKEICEGTILRSEFLLLRYLGNEKLKKGEIKYYLKFLKNKIIPSLPKKTIYRFCDYNNNDFNFLNNEIQSRGARRLVEDGSLFELDLCVVELLIREGIDIEILVPWVIFSKDFETLIRIVKSRCKKMKVGIMVEVISNLLEIENFSKADFYVFGPGDLLSLTYGGINRNDIDYNEINEEVIIPLIDSSLKKINLMCGRKRVYLVKNLIGKFNNHKNIDFVNTYMPSQIWEVENE